MTNNEYKWNRRKYNNMGYSEQNEYEKKLKAGRSFYINFNKVYSLDIPKTVFLVLNCIDTTKKELLN